MKRILFLITIFLISYYSIYAQQISGTIATETGVLINNVEVPPSNTNLEGFYEIQNPTLPFTIEPSKNDELLNGVNVCDIVAIARHILGSEILDSPYKVIAADVNGSNGVTTFDLVMMSQSILGGIDDFGAAGTSWKFVNKDYVFPNPFNPFVINTTGPLAIPTIDNLDQDVAVDFVAIKVGDTNDSVLSDYPSVTTADPDILPFEFADALVPQQAEYTLDFTAKDFVNGSAFQLTLNYDPTKMEFVELTGVGLTNPAFLNSNLVEPGIVAALWFDFIEATIPDGDVVFSATFNIFEAVQLAESVAFTSDFLPIITSTAEGCFGEPLAGPISSQEDISSLSSINIFPNPTQGLFDLQLELNNSKEVNVALYNVIGTNLLDKNYNSEFIRDQIDITHLADGIYFLSINVEGEILTQRIVKG